MISTISIQHGFAEEHRLAVAQLYDAAFGKKLGLAIPDQQKRLGMLCDTLLPKFCFVAMANEQPVGVAGFKTTEGYFTGGSSFHQLKTRLGLIGSLRAVAVFVLYHRELSSDELLMDGISVHPEMRGGGIGTKLLDRIRAYALDNGNNFIRLDVINTNPAARKLYARFGFVPTKTVRFPILGSILGFEASTTMKYDLRVAT